MNNEDDEPKYSEEEVGAYLSADFIRQLVNTEVERVRLLLNSNLHRVGAFLPYLTGMYYEDRQRQAAETQLFQLQVEQQELLASLANALAIMPDLHRPVSITHT